MTLWNRLFGAKSGNAPAPADNPTAAQCVELVIRFEHAGAGENERCKWEQFRDELRASVERNGAGTRGGEAWGEEGFALTFAGPDAEALWETIMPVIERIPIPRGSYAYKRFRALGKDREERIDLHWDG